MQPTDIYVDSTDTADALPVGTVIDGRYTITGVIALGGMGIVHRARHDKLEMDVAIKTVRRLLMLLPEAITRFVDEAHITSRLRSPHVARVFDFGRLHDGRPYLAMELLEGEDVATRLARLGPLSNDTVQDTLLQVCDALIEAHSAGIVHRDLKPENLFYARDGSGAEVVKVLDFGISKSRGRARALTMVGMGLGSPHYMAPEQMEGNADIDHRADIWTLGIVAHELLTGVVPFDGNGISEICARVVRLQRAPIEGLRADAWPALVSFADRCLRVRPADRFPDAQSARAALLCAKATARTRLPSVIIATARDSDPATTAHVVDMPPEMPPVERDSVAWLPRRRWPRALPAIALAGLAGWLVWAKPQSALAMGDRALAAVTHDTTLSLDEPALPVDRPLDAPSIAPLLVRDQSTIARDAVPKKAQVHGWPLTRLPAHSAPGDAGTLPSATHVADDTDRIISEADPYP